MSIPLFRCAFVQNNLAVAPGAWFIVASEVRQHDKDKRVERKKGLNMTYGTASFLLPLGIICMCFLADAQSLAEVYSLLWNPLTND